MSANLELIGSISERNRRSWELRMRRKGLSREDAEDAVGDAMLRILETTPAMINPECYLARAVQNAGRTIARRNLRRHEIPTDPTALQRVPDVGVGREDMERTLIRDEQSGRLAQAVESLPTRQRQITRLYLGYVQLSDIGSELGIDRNAVDVSFYRAKRNLRKSFSEQSVTLCI